MSLQNEMKESIKEALRARDEVRLSVVRGLTTAFTNELVAKGRKPTEELGDDDALVVIRRAAKQRKESIEQFRKGNREELAVKEEAELAILENYLPRLMSREEIDMRAHAIKDELGITEKAQSGKLMSALMAELKGKADGADVKAVVELLFI